MSVPLSGQFRIPRWILASLLLASVVGCGKSDSTPQQAALGEQPGSEAPPKPVPENQRVPQELIAIPGLAASGKSGEALKILGDWISSHPGDPRGYTLRAGIHAQDGRRDEAVADLNKLVELSPGDADAIHSRGLFYLMYGPQEKARQDFEAALKVDPRHEESSNHLGLVKLSAGEFLAAIKDFDVAIQGNPKNHSYFNNRGLAYWRGGNLELARTDFDTALKVNPEDANSFSNRGQLLVQQGKYEEAIADFTSAIAHDPYNMSHFRFRHAAYLKLGRLVDAENNGRRIVWLRKLFALQDEVRRHPEDQKCQVRLGRHFAEGHDDVMALKVFDNVLKNSPDEISALIGRARIMLQRKEYQQVIDNCTAILKLENSFDALSLRGDAWFELKKYDEAIADFEAAQRFDRQVSDAYYLRSQLRTAAGDQTGAAADLAKSKEMSPKLQTADGAE